MHHFTKIFFCGRKVTRASSNDTHVIEGSCKVGVNVQRITEMLFGFIEFPKLKTNNTKFAVSLSEIGSESTTPLVKVMNFCQSDSLMLLEESINRTTSEGGQSAPAIGTGTRVGRREGDRVGISVGCSTGTYVHACLSL